MQVSCLGVTNARCRYRDTNLTRVSCNSMIRKHCFPVADPGFGQGGPNFETERIMPDFIENCAKQRKIYAQLWGWGAGPPGHPPGSRYWFPPFKTQESKCTKIVAPWGSVSSHCHKKSVPPYYKIWSYLQRTKQNGSVNVTYQSYLLAQTKLPLCGKKKNIK